MSILDPPAFGRAKADGRIIGFILDTLVTRDSPPVIVARHIGDVTAAGLGTARSDEIFTAMFACKVVSVMVACHGSSVAADVSNFYTFIVRKYHGSTQSNDIATKGTSVTGITQRRGFRMDQNDYDTDTDNVLYRGDVLALVSSKTGSPATDLLGLNVTVKLEAL